VYIACILLLRMCPLFRASVDSDTFIFRHSLMFSCPRVSSGVQLMTAIGVKYRMPATMPMRRERITRLSGWWDGRPFVESLWSIQGSSGICVAKRARRLLPSSSVRLLFGVDSGFSSTGRRSH
jgi:hypothetical protein